MRIFAIADIHCSFNYSTIAAYHALREDVDLIIVAGDIECVDPIDELHATGIRLYAVTGNVDDPYIYRYLKERGILIDGMVIEYDGLYIAGVGGLNTKNDLERVAARLKDVPRGKLIIVSHYPPYGFNDSIMGSHAGLRELRRLVDIYKPRLFIHGHVHESMGMVRHDDTLVVNPGPLMYGYYAIIDLGARVEAELKRIEYW